jgi:type IV pilus assembly protein PilP
VIRLPRAPAAAAVALGLLVSGLLFGPVGCGSSVPPARAKPPPPPPIKTVEDDKPAPLKAVYVYSPVGKRDPFQNVFQIKESPKPRQVNLPIGPTQKFPLDRYRLVMTMTGTASPVAVVEDPDGFGWTIRVNSFIGQNWGKVTSIQREQIIVTETITDNTLNKHYTSDITIKVPRDPGELADLKQLGASETLGAAQTTPGN